GPNRAQSGALAPFRICRRSPQARSAAKPWAAAPPPGIPGPPPVLRGARGKKTWPPQMNRLPLPRVLDAAESDMDRETALGDGGKVPETCRGERFLRTVGLTANHVPGLCAGGRGAASVLEQFGKLRQRSPTRWTHLIHQFPDVARHIHRSIRAGAVGKRRHR